MTSRVRGWAAVASVALVSVTGCGGGSGGADAPASGEPPPGTIVVSGPSSDPGSTSSASASLDDRAEMKDPVRVGPALVDVPLVRYGPGPNDATQEGFFIIRYTGTKEDPTEPVTCGTSQAFGEQARTVSGKSVPETGQDLAVAANYPEYGLIDRRDAVYFGELGGDGVYVIVPQGDPVEALPIFCASGAASDWTDAFNANPDGWVWLPVPSA